MSHCGYVRTEFKFITGVGGILWTWLNFQLSSLDHSDIIIALLAVTPVSQHTCHLLLYTALYTHTPKSHIQSHTNTPCTHSPYTHLTVTHTATHQYSIYTHIHTHLTVTYAAPHQYSMHIHTYTPHMHRRGWHRHLLLIELADLLLELN